MGFTSAWLEQSYGRWRDATAARLIRTVLIVTAGSALLRTLAHVPGAAALWTANVLLLATVAVVFQIFRPQNVAAIQISALAVLTLDFVFWLPGHDALLPALLAIMATYWFAALPAVVVGMATFALTALQILCFVSFVQPLHTNEVRFFGNEEKLGMEY
ncbi:unnamed protein product [Caenorhabditis auriculariae]|uniref:Uncharacterized protein n=1 Tax=Caenorhabditis auriculariae TaxID=2777116 RepID=A0A8S1HP97_9PELO|nr:unnamed protein product [Caenorhabditis auriculariae]